MILSSLYPRFRDVAIIWQVLSTALFYATPIIYTADRIGDNETLRHILVLNPLSPIFELARKWIIEPERPLADNRFGRDAGAAGVDRDLPCDLRVRGLDLPPRGAPDR